MSKKSKNVAAPAAVLPIPTDTKPDQIKVVMVKLDDIAIMNKNDRTRDDAFMARVRELAASMGSIGLQQPIIVRKAKAPSDKSIVLIAGERRMLAAQMLGWIQIPAVVLEADADEDDIRAAENLQREDLDDAQKAFVIGDLVAKAEALTAAEHGCASSDDLATLAAPARDAIRKAAVAKVAERFGKPLQWVRDYAYVGGLPKRVRELGAAGRLSLAHLKALAAVVDPDTCTGLAEGFAAGEDLNHNPMGLLRDLQEAINRTLNSLAKVPWDLTIEFAGKIACQGCEHNSRNRTGLFEGRGKEMGARGDHGCMTDINFATDAESEGVCLNMACFKVKVDACKTAMRNAGNRIAGAAAEAKPKERGAVVGRLINQANQKHNFVKPTVFRKEVQERIDSKLEKPKGKAAPNAGLNRRAAEENAKREAGYRLSEAIRTRNGKLLDAWTQHVVKLPSADQALLLLAFETIPAMGCENGATPKHQRHTEVFKKLIDAALDSGSILGFDTITKHLPARVAEKLMDWRMSANVPLVNFLATKAGVKDLPPIPTLEQFLPKDQRALPKRGNAYRFGSSKDAKWSLVGTVKAIVHPGNSAVPYVEVDAGGADHERLSLIETVSWVEVKAKKSGKPQSGKPSGKKKVRKSKMSDAAHDGPSPATIASVMNDTDDRGRSERVKATKADAKQAAKDMDADAAGEIDPQEEV